MSVPCPLYTHPPPPIPDRNWEAKVCPRSNIDRSPSGGRDWHGTKEGFAGPAQSLAWAWAGVCLEGWTEARTVPPP